MRPIEAVPAAFLLALAAGIVLGTAELPYWDGTTPGAGFFPTWVAGAAVLLAVVMLAAQLRGGGDASLDLPDRTGLLRVGLMVASMVAMVLASPVIGMVPAVALFIAFLLIVVLRQPLVPSLLTTAIVAVGIEGIFVRWLGVPLPAPFLL